MVGGNRCPHFFKSIPMNNCIKNLIAIGDKCTDTPGLPCAVYSFNDIPWFDETKVQGWIDSRYTNSAEFKDAMLRAAIIDLEVDLSSFMSSKATVKDVVGYYNNYGVERTDCYKDANSKGLYSTNHCTCTIVKHRLESFTMYTMDTEAKSVTVYVQIDNGQILPFTFTTSGKGVDNIKVCDAEGNSLVARKNFFIYTNNADLTFCKKTIPCQTGCGGAIKNECAFVEGVHNGVRNDKLSYGIEAHIVCFCDYSELLCTTIGREKLAKLLLIKLEYRCAEYFLHSGRTNLFDQSNPLVAKRIETNSKTYPELFTAYIEPTIVQYASDSRYKQCIDCNGITYGTN